LFLLGLVEGGAAVVFTCCGVVAELFEQVGPDGVGPVVAAQAWVGGDCVEDLEAGAGAVPLRREVAGGDYLLPLTSGVLAAPEICELAAGDGDQPGDRLVRDAAGGPPGRGGEQRFLDVARVIGHGICGSARPVARGEDHRTDLDREPVGTRDPRGELVGSLRALAVDDVEATHVPSNHGTL
jgi:hypothetical protein